MIFSDCRRLWWHLYDQIVAVQRDVIPVAAKLVLLCASDWSEVDLVPKVNDLYQNYGSFSHISQAIDSGHCGQVRDKYPFLDGLSTFNVERGPHVE